MSTTRALKPINFLVPSSQISLKSGCCPLKLKERGEKVEPVFIYTITCHNVTKTVSLHNICVIISIHCSRATILSASFTAAHHKLGYHPCAISHHNVIHAPCTTIHSLNADHDTRKKASPSITCPPSNHLGGPSMLKPVFMQCIRVFPPHATNPLLPRAIRSRKSCRKGSRLQSATNTTHSWQDGTVASLCLVKRWPSLSKSLGNSLRRRDGRLNSDSLEDLLFLCWNPSRYWDGFRSHWCWISDRSLKSGCVINRGCWCGIESRCDRCRRSVDD